MKANEFFTQEWGTGFIKATLSEKNGLLEMSMKDIYSTMEKYAELRLSNVAEKNKQLVAFGIWLDKNNKHIENGNITETVKEYLKDN